MDKEFNLIRYVAEIHNNLLEKYHKIVKTIPKVPNEFEKLDPTLKSKLTEEEYSFVRNTYLPSLVSWCVKLFTGLGFLLGFLIAALLV